MVNVLVLMNTDVPVQGSLLSVPMLPRRQTLCRGEGLPALLPPDVLLGRNGRMGFHAPVSNANES